MREFTQEEKELIVNTPIDCEDFTILGYKDDGTFSDFIFSVGIKTEEEGACYIRADSLSVNLSTWLEVLEQLRQKYLETKDERYFTELVRLLPNSYKVVKL